MEHYKFFQNRDCEYFPCHAGADPETFSCLNSTSPLYALGSACGGRFRYLENGIKDCSACLRPHRAESYDGIVARFPELAALARERR